MNGVIAFRGRHGSVGADTTPAWFDGTCRCVGSFVFLKPLDLIVPTSQGRVRLAEYGKVTEETRRDR